MHTEEELLEMALHVLYELEEFNAAIAECDRLRSTGGASDRHLWNRTFESVLLHFRNLRGFFIDDPRRPEDASARDYLSRWLPNPNSIFKTTREPLNYKLAHLSWNRLQEWPRQGFWPG